MKDLDPPAGAFHEPATLYSESLPATTDWAAGSRSLRARAPDRQVGPAGVCDATAAERLALLAHDLRNMMLVVQGNLEFVTTFFGKELSERPTAFLAAAYAGTERMGVLLGQTLDVFQLEERRVVMRTTVELESLLTECVRLYTPRDVEAEIHVEASGSVATVDANLVERAVANVLFNAVRYVNPGGRIQLSAEVVTTDRGEELVLDIGNTGAPPDAQEDTLFARFGVGSNGKLGLGLYFCRLVCEAHGGRIGLVPLPGLPTNFRMILR